MKVGSSLDFGGTGARILNLPDPLAADEPAKSKQIISPIIYIPSRYYSNLAEGSISSVAMSANQIFYCPFIVYRVTTFDRIAVNVATAQTGGEARLGIRNFANGAAGSIALDAGTINCSTTGAKEIVINSTLQPGQYFLLLWNKVASTAFSAYSNSPGLLSTIGSAAIIAPGGNQSLSFVAINITYTGNAFDINTPEIPSLVNAGNSFAPIFRGC
jgi:hypothetical protein